MAATRDARTAKRKLAELGITSATVLTGSTTITIDLAAFDELCRRSRMVKDVGKQSFNDGCICLQKIIPQRRPDCPVHGVHV